MSETFICLHPKIYLVHNQNDNNPNSPGVCLNLVEKLKPLGRDNDWYSVLYVHGNTFCVSIVRCKPNKEISFEGVVARTLYAIMHADEFKLSLLTFGQDGTITKEPITEISNSILSVINPVEKKGLVDVTFFKFGYIDQHIESLQLHKQMTDKIIQISPIFWILITEKNEPEYGFNYYLNTIQKINTLENEEVDKFTLLFVTAVNQNKPPALHIYTEPVDKNTKSCYEQFVEEFKVADFTGHKLAPFIYPSGADVLYYLGHFNYDDSVVNSLNILRKSTCSSTFMG